MEKGKDKTFATALRRLHLDFHNPMGINDFVADFNPEEFADTIADAGFDVATVFAMCAHGHCYYPSKIGKPYPGLKRDLLGEMISALHAKGVLAGVYISAGCTDYVKPEYRQLKADGKPRIFNEQGGYSKACANSPYTEEFLLPLTEEVISKYPIDGMFLDNLFSLDAGCHCKWCLEKIKKLGLDPSDTGDILKLNSVSMGDFAEKVASVVWKVNPKIELIYNSMQVNENPAGLDFASGIDVEALATGGWGYFYFPSKARYIRTLNIPVAGMTAAFHGSWGDFGTLKTKELLEYECYTFLAAGSVVSVGDQLHPRGKLEEVKYKRIGEVLNPIKSFQHLIAEAKPLTEAAVVLPPLGQGQFPSPSWAGVTKLLMEQKIQFDTVDIYSEWGSYPLLIFPDDAYDTDEVRQKTKSYIEQGGKVLATGDALKILPPELVNAQSEKLQKPHYLDLDNDIFKDVPEIPIVFQSGYIPINAPDAEVLATIMEPYESKEINFFFSRPQTPYHTKTTKPAIVQAENVTYIATNLFEEYWNVGSSLHRLVLASCIGRVIPDPLVTTDLPLAYEVALLEQENLSLCVIVPYAPTRSGDHVEQIEDWPTIADTSLTIKGAFKKAYSAIDKKEFDIKCSDNLKTTVFFDKLKGPQVIVLDKR